MMLLLLLQVYPTEIRALFGMALCLAVGRIGGMTAPFITHVYTRSRNDMKLLHYQPTINCFKYLFFPRINPEWNQLCTI